MNFISLIGNKIFQTGAVILGALLLFFTLRRKYITKGEQQAELRANRAVINRIRRGQQNAKILSNLSDDDTDRMLRETGAEYQ